jgi:hypothetical protein
LAEGLGIRAVARVFEVDPNTVLAWLLEVADHATAFSRYFLHDVHATLDTDDGALIAVTYYGRLDLGEDSYQKYLQGDDLRGFLPGEIPLRMALHFHTTYPNYLWLNRLQGLAVGLIEPARPVVIYDVYAVR